MDINEKLDIITGMLEEVLARQQEQEDRDAELREAITDLGLPGTGFSTFTPED